MIKNAVSERRPFGLRVRAALFGRARGSTSLEFAILSVPFMMFLLFLFEVGVDFYLQLALNYAVQQGARNVQTGAAQGVTTSQAFLTQYMCPAIAGLLNCNQISVNVQDVTTNFYTQAITYVPTNSTTHQVDTSGFQFSPCQPNSLMEVNALYTSPTIVGYFLPFAPIAYPGPSGMVRITTASTAFINEPYVATSNAQC